MPLRSQRDSIFRTARVWKMVSSGRYVFRLFSLHTYIFFREVSLLAVFSFFQKCPESHSLSYRSHLKSALYNRMCRLLNSSTRVIKVKCPAHRHIGTSVLVMRERRAFLFTQPELYWRSGEKWTGDQPACFSLQYSIDQWPNPVLYYLFSQRQLTS